MVTVQILTKNNSKTIQKTLESLQKLNADIVVGDLGSSDETLNICSKYKTKILNLEWEYDYSKARNKLVNPDNFNLYIEPWEVLKSGHDQINQLSNSAYFYIINKGTVSKEIRFWKDIFFKNPVYETIEDKEAKYETEIIISSDSYGRNSDELLNLTKKWAQSKPTLSDPYYYLACSHLFKKQYREFFTYANQYLLMENKANESSIMLYYYMSKIELHIGSIEKSLKHIAKCLAFCPSFAEFWCVLGDIFYKKQEYDKSKSMYKNALIIGKRRLKSDAFPIEIEKYNNYPKKMIKNIEDIKEKISFIIQK